MIETIIVDDEPNVRRGLRMTVPWAEHGFVVVGEASNGSEALEILAATKVRFVLSDIRMPVLDGLSLAERLRDGKSGTRIVLLTGHEDFDYARRAIRAGVLEYLLKPVDMGELCALLDRVKASIEAEERRDVMLGLLAPELERRLFGLFFDPSPFSEEEIREEAALLGLEVGAGPFVLLVVSSDSLPEAEARETAARLAGASLGGAGFVLSRGAGSVIVAVLDPGEDAGDRARSLAEAFGQAARNQSAGAWSIAIPPGSAARCAGLAGLAGAYALAVKVLECRFLLGAGRIHEELPPRRTAGIAPERLAVFSRARALLEAGETERVAFAINDLMAELAADGAGREEVLDVAHRLLSLAEEASRQSKAPSPQAFGEVGSAAAFRNAAVPRLEDSRTIWALRDALKAAIFALGPDLGASRHSQLVRKAMEQVKRRFSEESLVSKIAESLRVSPNHLSRKFREETGETMGDYCRSVRLEEARRLIAESDLKLFEIAEEVGMSDYKYFVESFKKAYGLRPSDLRRPSGGLEELPR